MKEVPGLGAPQFCAISSYESLPPMSMTSRIAPDSLEKAVLGERPSMIHNSVGQGVAVFSHADNPSEQNVSEEEEENQSGDEQWQSQARSSDRFQEEDEQESTSQILSVTDHLTNPETLDFWHRYFQHCRETDVKTELFCDVI